MIFYLTFPKYTAFRDTAVPLFVNRAAIFRDAPKGRALPRARGPWALDSGGYMELKQHGEWTVKPDQYVREVRRASKEIGNLQWAATQDWMCEAEVLARTGKTVTEHQWLTIESYHQLRAAGGPELEHLWVPVLQGSCPDEYVTHFEMWMASGIDLRMVNVVGVGSVCRQWQNTRLRDTFSYLQGQGLERLHGFGVKQSSLEWEAVLRRPSAGPVADLYRLALERGYPYELLEDVMRRDPTWGAITWEEDATPVCHFLYSADSAAWSSRARRQANEVRAAREVLAAGREWREEDGNLYVGNELVGRIVTGAAGLRARAGGGPEAALLPTQMRPECAERAALWRGKGRRPHASCNLCMPWALEYRTRLRALLEPEGCWEERSSKRALPPPSYAPHRAAIEQASQRAEEWAAFGPERFAPLAALPRWAKIQALRKRADAGDDEAAAELHRLRVERSAEEGLDEPEAT